MGTRKAKRCTATNQFPSDVGYNGPKVWLGEWFTCPVCGQLAKMNQTGTIRAHYLPLDSE